MRYRAVLLFALTVAPAFAVASHLAAVAGVRTETARQAARAAAGASIAAQPIAPPPPIPRPSPALPSEGSPS